MVQKITSVGACLLCESQAYYLHGFKYCQIQPFCVGIWDQTLPKRALHKWFLYVLILRHLIVKPTPTAKTLDQTLSTKILLRSLKKSLARCTFVYSKHMDLLLIWWNCCWKVETLHNKRLNSVRFPAITFLGAVFSCQAWSQETSKIFFWLAKAERWNSKI